LHRGANDFLLFYQHAAAFRFVVSNYGGELHGSKRHFILSGVSSRVYLKQQNDACETLLASMAEPLAILAWLRGGTNNVGGFLAQAWKALVKNHAHDSICGSGIDAVHREMLPRFDQARQIGENVVAAALDTLAQKVRRLSSQENGAAFVVPILLPCRAAKSCVRSRFRRRSPSQKPRHLR
jgi:hypothetical protein